ncbi:MAG: curli production assembly protein CsgG [Xanthobacteraceae bacterium]|nr:curli production assembly protein CsgG [Xanthobacteraceae bacterium]
MSRNIVRLLLLSSVAVALAGCMPDQGGRDFLEQPPTLTPSTPTTLDLDNLPKPRRKLDIAVYQFPDLTGKNEPNDNVAVFSHAVTQGGAGFVVDALQRAGHGRWFTVDERTGLNDLLQERQLVKATRAEFEGDNARPLPPVRFAGLLLEGGIIAFDGNVMTGGAGANYLNIGGNVNYRRDTVTVAMRIVSVQTGAVLTSVTTTKTVYSIGIQANVYQFVSVNRLLQAEAGVTKTEPTQLAVRQAIDLAVYSTVLQGAQKGLWTFANPAEGRSLLESFALSEAVTPTELPGKVKKPNS